MERTTEVIDAMFKHAELKREEASSGRILSRLYHHDVASELRHWAELLRDAIEEDEDR